MSRRRGAMASEAFEERVRQIFIERGRLRLPAKRKKRLVVLRWAADLFRPAERYPERVVNDVLGRYCDDVATLRRMLVDEEFLQRAAGVYWRTGTLPPP
ncbi:MAG: DUF2087 domain-containing protein [Candidatus Dormibacteraceae bacterium]